MQYTVVPVPVAVPADTIICNDSYTQIVLGNSFQNMSFRWTAGGSSDITGYSSDSLSLPFTISDSLHNSSNEVEVINYTITPFAYGLCQQPDITVPIYVNPTPRFTVEIADTIVCDSTTITLDVTDLLGNVQGDKVYDLTTTYNPAAIAGVQANGEYPITEDVTDQLINLTQEVQTVIYNFRYRLNDSRNGGAPFCDHGVDTTITVYVNPTPRFTVEIADTIVCDSTTITLDVTDLLGNVQGDKVYDLTTTYNPAAVTGVSPDGEYHIGDDLFDQLINLTDQYQEIRYNFRYMIKDNRSGNNFGYCDHGIDTTITVYLEPTPKVTFTIINDTLCDGEELSFSLFTPSTAVIGVEYNISITDAHPEISGYNSRIGLSGTDNPITDVLTNSGDTARMIRYILSPFTLDVNGLQKCSGIRDTIEVWINPTPRIIPISSFDRICDDEMAVIELTTPTVMTHGQIRFDYSVVVTGGSGDVTGDTSPQVNLEPGHQIMTNFRNTSDTVQAVYYYTIPRSAGTGCLPGSTEVTEVKINPLPLQEIVVTNPLSCFGGTDLALEAVLAKGTGPMDVFWTGPDGAVYYDPTITNLIGGLYMATVTDNFGCVNAESIIATTDPIIASFATIKKQPYLTDLSCHDASDGQIRVWVTSSTTEPPYDYWVVHNDADTVASGWLSGRVDIMDPTTMDTIYNLSAGKYSLIVRNSLGCIISPRPVTHIRPPDPITFTYSISDYSGFNVSCKGYADGEITIDEVAGGVGDYTYFWYTNSGTIPGDNTAPSISGVTAGKYYIEITDGFGCVKLDSIVVNEPDGITLEGRELSLSNDGSFNISCHGNNDGSINLTFSGGSGIVSYDWSGPVGAGLVQDQEDQFNLIAGYYELEVTDNNGCKMWFDTTLVEPDPLAVVISATETPDAMYNISCNGGTADVDITVTGGSGSGYIYTWTTTDGTGIVPDDEDQAGITAGRYYVSIEDINGCLLIDSIDITEPDSLIIELLTTDITCESAGMDNGSIDLTVTGGADSYTYNYSWSQGSTTEDISGLTEGRYYITVTDQYGCVLTDSADIQLPPPLEIEKIVSDYNGFGISCNGLDDGSITINVTSGEGPYTYSWSGTDGFVSSDSAISTLRAGEYYIEIVDMNMCRVEDTILLQQPGPLSITADVSGSLNGGFNINCAGDSSGFISLGNVNGVGEGEYFWTDGYRGDFRDNLPAGNYGVLIADNNNCTADTVITLTEPAPLVLDYTIDQPYCIDMPDGTITLNPSGGVVVTDYLFTWYDNSTSGTLSDISAGKYEVTVTDANGCAVTEIIEVTSERESCLTIPNAISPNGDRINDVWNIEFLWLYPEVEIRILNRWGAQVWASERGYPQPWDGKSNGRDLPVDSYHYIINLNNGTRPIIGNITIIK
ncbi:MAG: PKD-like domain-containing protein [Bacteroidales bacterium]